eukprot:9025713-Lingulodinium_polyedra.AAC.1
MSVAAVPAAAQSQASTRAKRRKTVSTKAVAEVASAADSDLNEFHMEWAAKIYQKLKDDFKLCMAVKAFIGKYSADDQDVFPRNVRPAT